MVGNLLLLEQTAHAEHVAELLDGVEEDRIWSELRSFVEAAPQHFAQAGLVGLTVGGDVQQHLVAFVRVITMLAQLDLPGGDTALIVEEMLEDIEVHQRAFELVEIQRAALAHTRDWSDDTRALAAAVRARFPREAALRDVPRAIAQHHRAARVKRCEHDLARRTIWN